MNRKIKVLVVDDSAVVRRMITNALASDPEIEVVGAAIDPYMAREMILKFEPDVLTLDIEMPRTDGLRFLKILQQHRPIPAILINSLKVGGSKAAVEAMRCGAVDVLAKPTSAYAIGNFERELPRRIKTAALARKPSKRGSAPGPRLTPNRSWNPRQIVCIGASTGGVEALDDLLTHLPDGLPGIAIVQHIPPYFSRVFAERMNQKCAFEVREAADGDELHPGLALIAPGDYHMAVAWSGGSYRVALNQKPHVHHCRPSVDVMFRSIADCPGAQVVAAILTGMGIDGALGLKALKAAGARTIAQDEATSVVYGMPRAAAATGAVDDVLPLPQIAGSILTKLRSQSARAAAAPAAAVS